MKTASKQRYAIVYGCKVEFYRRPLASNGGYKEPKRMASKRYRTIKMALQAAKEWEA